MWKKIVIIAAVVLVIAGGVTWFMLHRNDDEIIYNQGYVNGNTAGNLYNAGLFCEHNGVVYFANPDDQMKLYAMNSDGSDVRKINDDVALYINADDHYVYYIRSNKDLMDLDFFSFFTNSLCRMSLKTEKIALLETDPSLYASLIGNDVYYLKQESDTKPTTTFKVCIDRTGMKEIKRAYAYTCSTYGQYFYYNGESDGNLYRYDTASDTEEMIYECNCYKPTMTSSEDVYYMDVDNDNRLVHVNLTTGEKTMLTEDSVDCYNLYGSYIYYQRYNEKDGNALCVVKDDGTESQIIAWGNYQNICATSHYIYFMDYRTRVEFRVPITNPTLIEQFHPGVDQ